MSRKQRGTSSRKCLAANLRTARALLGWSQADLALKCGFKKSYLGALERAEFNLGIENLDKLALSLGLPTYMLLLRPASAQPHIVEALADMANPNTGRAIQR